MESTNQFIDAVIERLQTTLPLPEGVQLRCIAEFGGLLSESEIRRIAAVAPSLWVTVLATQDTRSAGRRGQFQTLLDMQIAIVSCDQRTINRHRLARALEQNIKSFLLYETWSFIPRDEVTPAINITSRTLFDGATDAQNLSLWVVEWQQSIVLDRL